MPPKRMCGVWTFGVHAGWRRGSCVLLTALLMGCAPDRSESAPSPDEVVLVPKAPASRWQSFAGTGAWGPYRIHARLRPLMPTLERAESDARAWHLGSGQIVWNLQWTLANIEPTPGAGATAPSLPVDEMRVVHGGGQALIHPSLAEVSDPSGVYDPLQVLLSNTGAHPTAGTSWSISLIGPMDLEAPKWVIPSLELDLLPETDSELLRPDDIPILNLAQGS